MNILPTFSKLKHDPITGKRTAGNPRFLKSDNKRMPACAKNLPEPQGSWYTGPFANKGLLMELQEWIERKITGQKPRERNKEVELETLPTWGTPNWKAVQQATTARRAVVKKLKSSLL